MDAGDDDLHYCLKCRLSFYGLDNYVNHRKKVCGKVKENKIRDDLSASDTKFKAPLPIQDKDLYKEALPINLTTIDRDNLRSDDRDNFNTSDRDNLITSRKDNIIATDRINEVSPLNNHCLELAAEDLTKTSKSSPKDSNILQNQTSHEDFSRLYDPLFQNDASVSSFLKSFDNFPEPNKLSEHQLLFPGKDSSNQFDIDGQNYEQRYNIYNQLTCQDIDNDVDASSSNKLVEPSINRNKLPELNSNVQSFSDIQQDAFLSSLELSSVKLLNEKRNYEFDEVEEDEEYDEHQPPSHHTGGKWKPETPTNVAGKWRPFSPNLAENPTIDDTHYEKDSTLNNTVNRKPTLYTKGKWLPGKQPRRSVRSSVSYHCYPCHKEFKTKSSYTRHLMANFHQRIMKIQDETNISEDRPSRKKKAIAQKFLKSTIANMKRKKPIFSSDGESRDDNITSDKSIPSNQNNNIIPFETTVRETNDKFKYHVTKITKTSPKMKCPICRLSFGKAYLTNHFASLAHIHNELESKRNFDEKETDEQNEIILNNIERLITVCQFHCKDCKFYCNTQDDLQRHISSHREITITDMKVNYICSVCPDETIESSSDLHRHVIIPSHKFAVQDAILSAKQVTISSQRCFTCQDCVEEFRFYRQFEDHRRKNHQSANYKSHSRTPKLCPLCDFKGSTRKRILVHIREVHNRNPEYLCMLCGIMYSTMKDIKEHRRSRQHRLRSGIQKDKSSSCTYCYDYFESSSDLRLHVKLKHKAHCTPCFLCGYIPNSSADLQVHHKNCNQQVSYSEDIINGHKCDLCHFTNPLLANVLTHVLLVHRQVNEDASYTCQLCLKVLKKNSVRSHMLYHSKEFPHLCHICSRSFAVKDWLEKHKEKAHRNSINAIKSLCQFCGSTFSTRTSLAQHQTSNKCAQMRQLKKENSRNAKKILSRTSQRLNDKELPICELCGLQCPTTAALKKHQKSHRDTNEVFHCKGCSYVTESLPHMRRHLRLHTGVKPFKCPHCDYSTNVQENLRRHIKSNKHPGRCLYECQFCCDESMTENFDEPSNEIPINSEITETNKKANETNTINEKKNKLLSEKKKHDNKSKVTTISESKLLITSKYKTNFASEFKEHLQEFHDDEFDTDFEMMRHIRSYYHPEEDILSFSDDSNFNTYVVRNKRKTSRAVINSPEKEDTAEESNSEDHIHLFSTSTESITVTTNEFEKETNEIDEISNREPSTSFGINEQKEHSETNILPYHDPIRTLASTSQFQVQQPQSVMIYNQVLPQFGSTTTAGTVLAGTEGTVVAGQSGTSFVPIYPSVTELLPQTYQNIRPSMVLQPLSLSSGDILMRPAINQFSQQCLVPLKHIPSSSIITSSDQILSQPSTSLNPPVFVQHLVPMTATSSTTKVLPIKQVQSFELDPIQRPNLRLDTGCQKGESLPKNLHVGNCSINREGNCTQDYVSQNISMKDSGNKGSSSIVSKPGSSGSNLEKSNLTYTQIGNFSVAFKKVKIPKSKK